MNTWKKIRVAIIFLVFVQGLLIDGIAPPPSDVPLFILPVIFIFGVIGMPFVIGIQYINPASPENWEKPDWSSNFLSIKNPINGFHFFSLVIFSAGVGVILRHLFYNNSLAPNSFFMLCLSLGLITGLKLCLLLFSKKFKNLTSSSSGTDNP